MSCLLPGMSPSREGGHGRAPRFHRSKEPREVPLISPFGGGCPPAPSSHPQEEATQELSYPVHRREPPAGPPSRGSGSFHDRPSRVPPYPIFGPIKRQGSSGLRIGMEQRILNLRGQACPGEWGGRWLAGCQVAKKVGGRASLSSQGLGPGSVSRVREGARRSWRPHPHEESPGVPSVAAGDRFGSGPGRGGCLSDTAASCRKGRLGPPSLRVGDGSGRGWRKDCVGEIQVSIIESGPGGKVPGPLVLFRMDRWCIGSMLPLGRGSWPIPGLLPDPPSIQIGLNRFGHP